MEKRPRFIARRLEGESMTDLCRQFGISAKTGYKLFDRYKDHGLEAFSDRSRRHGPLPRRSSQERASAATLDRPRVLS